MILRIRPTSLFVKCLPIITVTAHTCQKKQSHYRLHSPISAVLAHHQTLLRNVLASISSYTYQTDCMICFILHLDNLTKKHDGSQNLMDNCHCDNHLKATETDKVGSTMLVNSIALTRGTVATLSFF